MLSYLELLGNRLLTLYFSDDNRRRTTSVACLSFQKKHHDASVEPGQSDVDNFSPQ